VSLLGVSTVVAWWRRALKKAWERSAWGGVAGGNVELDMSNAHTLYNGSSQRDTAQIARSGEKNQEYTCHARGDLESSDPTGLLWQSFATHSRD